MTNAYTIWIISPPNLIWSHVFDEVALGLQSAFKTLGYSAEVVTDPKRIEGIPIVLGANLCPMYKIALPDNAVIYNLEQVHAASRWFERSYGYIELLQKYPVWDFSQRNIELLKDYGVHDVVHCGVGYAPELSSIKKSKEDVDVVFIGGHHPRRKKILDDVVAGGAQLQQVYKVFGKERDEWMARGKIHLNIHKEPAELFEIVRVSYLLANRCFVISEHSKDSEVTQTFNDGVVFCDYDDIAQRALHYLVNPKERKRIAEAGFEIMRSQPQSEFLSKALEQHNALRASKSRKAPELASPVAGMPRIFVAMASFRDPETEATLQDLFNKAFYPSRISAGVCLQVHPQDDVGCTIGSDLRPKQIRVIQFDCRESKGANWARDQALKLMQGEEYVLMIDSHMRFTAGWDETLLQMLAECRAPKPVLSAYLPDYNPPNKLIHHQGRLLRMRLKKPATGKDSRLIHISAELVADQEERATSLYPTPFCIANFIFAPAATFAEVPIDPHIHFWGDEINQAARLWTHGYDIFQPNCIIAYHYWVRKEQFHLHDYRKYQNEKNVRSLKRIRHLLGLEKSTDPEVLLDIEHYGLGKVRDLKLLWNFAGIDLVRRTITDDAEKGIWNLSAREPDLSGSASTLPAINLSPVTSLKPESAMSGLRIFVQIASYRDPDCQKTVKDLFKKAKHPERVFVGICWQFVKEEDQLCFETPYPYPDQVRVLEVDAKDSGGVCWARSQVQKLWQGEEFTLQIDSHMRFEYGWDEMLLSMWKECGSEKAVLTCYPPGFTPPNRLDRRFIFGMAAKEFDKSDIFLMLGYPAYKVGKEEPAKPMLGAFLSANMVFGPASIISDVPYDPYLYFFGEEISMAVRLWTHGYDLYHPNKLVIFHDWVRTKRPTHFSDFVDWRVPNQRSFERVKHMLGIKITDDPVVLQDFEHFGLGKVRTLDQYQDFSGVNFAQKAISSDAFKGHFPPAKARPELANDIIVNLSHTPKQSKSSPMIKHSAGKIPKIFINIASYRDPECQWTVKDLFEKAAHPERINVGICWQFDPVEDKHCFEVTTRPDQVRIMPVDWREAEGVCWARHHTQNLWEGEEYTLMTDSHMRFVPGWDELMIRELDACESNKPVISCSPVPYTPPNKLGERMNPTIRRVKPFQPDGNIRCQGEMLDRSPEKPLNAAFLVANYIFSRSEITPEVPYDPFLYFDQEEISYAARVYTHGWDIFSARKQFLYHFYNDKKVPTGSVRPLHWRDLHKKDEARIRYLRERGLKRFNHLTRYSESTEADVIQELDKYGFGTVRSIDQYEQYSGVDFKHKIATERALRCQFIENLGEYRDRPIHIPEIDDNKPKPKPQEIFYSDSNYPPVRALDAAPAIAPSAGRAVPVLPKPVAVATGNAIPASEVLQTQPIERQPVQVLPKLLEVGDYFPFIEVNDTNQKVRAIEMFGGKFTIVVYLPSNDTNFLIRYFREIGLRITAAKLQEVWQIHILDDTVDNLIALRNSLTITPNLHADPKRAIARSFGIANLGGAFTPVGFVLSPNLKIEYRHVHNDPLQLAAGLVHYCALEMEKLKQKNQDQKVISEMAPALIVPNALSPELCAKLIHAFKTGRTFDGTVGALEGKAYRADIKVRTDYVVYGDLLAEVDEKLSRSFFPEIKKIFGFEVAHRELYKVGLYSGEKKGFFRQHRDNFDNPLGYRRVAATVHLNDEYEGGGLRFPEYDDHVYRPKAGSGIAFSCATLHEARPVTQGERYVLVAFFHSKEDEAYRHHFNKEKKIPNNDHDFTPKLRVYPDVRQSRAFYEKWQSENVSYSPQVPVINPMAANSNALAVPSSVSTLGTMINTIGNHRARKVLETKQVIVIDDFLPEDVFKMVHSHALTTDYERINTHGKSVRAWHVHDGFPLRTCNNIFYNAPGHSNHRGENAYPTRTANDRFIDHVLSAQPHVEHMIGKQSEQWEHFSVTGWMYPPGTGLSMHDDGSGVYSGAYVYFMNPVWRPHWGGLLVVMDEEANKKIFEYRTNVDEIDYYKRKWLHANPLDDMLMDNGLSQCIFPKRNRIVFMANDAYHMVTRVNEQAGDNLRMSLAGFFNKKR